MCRLLGIVASEPTEFGLVLEGAPRSLARLSCQHPDGWGIATYDAGASAGFHISRGVDRADQDRRFHEVAARSRGHVLVAHIRAKTVGATRLENTHPFTRDGWVFAHNGTIPKCDVLRAGCTPERLAQIEGDTDSELLFAYVLSRLDEAGLVRMPDLAAREAATAMLASMTRSLREAEIGAFNFLLTDGDTCFAHRLGRTLFVLERGPTDPVRERRDVSPGASIVTRWTARRRAVFVASERITDEPWREIDEGTLFRIDRAPEPRLVLGERAHRAA